MCAAKYEKQSYLNDAERLLNEGVEAFPASAGLRVERARLYMESRRWKESIDDLVVARQLALNAIRISGASPESKQNQRLLERIDDYLKLATHEAAKAKS